MKRLFLTAALLLLCVAGNAQAPADKPASWQYGAFLDAGYLWTPNGPFNHLFRSRGTTYKLNETILNMAGAYLRKLPTSESRWGVELNVHGGQDSRIFGFSASAPNMPGHRGLRHLGPTNVSYLAPVGRGLTLQGGRFSSFVGMESLYAKDNGHYTRSWAADFTPYLMLGVNAVYPVNDRVTVAGFVINGYWHLANANRVPTFGGQIAVRASLPWTIKQTLMVGPHQANVSPELWRFLSDTSAEWKQGAATIAFNTHIGTEKVANSGQRALWLAAQLPLRRQFSERLSVSLRPEVYWDRDGRTTTYRQTVKSLTSTFDYRVPVSESKLLIRLEHRVDDSRGREGGFFEGNRTSLTDQLTPSQNLLSLGLVWTWDKTHP